jgi:nucleotide-binding universal stress UspA family protein
VEVLVVSRSDKGSLRAADNFDGKVAALKARLAAAGAARAAAGELVGFQNPDEWLPQWLASQRRDAEEWHASHPDAERADTATPARRKRAPTLASVAKQASKAGIEVSRYEVKPDGSVVVVPGEPQTEPSNPWLAEVERMSKQ